ncbi:MAG: dihydroorotate dehydrogenase electron transfer subunit [Crenarchaeota archaeon]|nr:dihydroorotate dehydrogenase electron transfer subunit [Thermoproteota archaeon]MDW8033550.1 dihydroorotate dehydrogenase electron transfer subunit [Nitrososphaerota archaeon]
MFEKAHYYIEAEVESNIMETSRVNTLTLKLDRFINIKPGQFLMVWRPGDGEIPITPSLTQGNTICLTIEKVGFTSNRLANLKVGEKVFLRGPYGNGFNLEHPGKYLLVGGGTGAASLTPAYLKLVEKGVYTLFLVGGRNIENLVYVNKLREIKANIQIATDDGSEGFHGTLPELFKKTVSEDFFENVLTIGPEKMMFKIAEECLKRGMSCQVSLVRIVKCGIGFCGSCVLDPVGLRICVEGPVFNASEILGTDFGFYMRDEMGRRIEVTL